MRFGYVNAWNGKIQKSRYRKKRKGEQILPLALHLIRKETLWPTSLVTGFQVVIILLYVYVFFELSYFSAFQNFDPLPTLLFDFNPRANSCYSGLFVIMKSWNNLKYWVTVILIFKSIWQEPTVINTFLYHNSYVYINQKKILLNNTLISCFAIHISILPFFNADPDLLNWLHKP